jgi:hypothetical protein
MLELFSHKLNTFDLNGDAQCIPIPVEDELSSLSAILLNDEYYDLITNSCKTINNVPIITPECLIALKVKAFLNLTERKASGKAIDSDKIKKHKYDVFRVAQIIAEDSRFPLAVQITEDFKRFIGLIRDEPPDLKSLGIRGITVEEVLELISKVYNVK